jgi:hypothetical protein
VIKRTAFAFLGVALILGVYAAAISGQTSEVKEKTPMYTYVADWNIPRAQWAEMEKTNASTQSIMEKALASGTLVGYGNDTTLVHEPDGATHDGWWSATSMAGILNVLDQIYKAGNANATVFNSATKHWDSIYVSRYYNWRSGSWKDLYTHGSSYKFKADAPDNALDTLSKNLFVPLFEKLLADGTLYEYDIDTQAVHTEAPGMFFIFYITPNAEGLDKVNAAIRDALKANPLGGPAFSSLVDTTPHRDDLARTSATFK